MQTVPEQDRSLSDALKRRPAVSAAILFMIGIVLHAWVPYAPAWWLGAGVLTVVTAGIGRKRAGIGEAALAVALVMIGLAGAQVERFGYARNHIGHFASDEPVLAELEMRIDQPPRTLEATRSYLPPRQVTQGDVLRIRTKAGWVEARGRVLLSISEPLETLAVRQRVRALGMLARPMGAMNPGQFDWQRYYRDDRVVAALRVAHRGSVAILEDPGPTALDRARAWVRAVLEKGFNREQALDHALLRALVLGDPDPQLRDVQEQFLRTGTSHHLAISGMHVTVVGALVYLCCRIVMLTPRKAAWIGMGVVAVYVLVAMPSAPVIRSGLLCVAVGMGIVMRRSVDGVQLLALSVLAMLALHPLDLYAAGFQLSFATVFGLMLFTEPVRAYLDSFKDIDRVVAESFRKPSRRVRAWRRAWRAGRDVFIAGFVAWAVATPLVLYHFNQLNPWAVVASLVLAIPVTAALIAGVLKIVLTGLAPWLATGWATVAAWPVGAMRWLVDGLATLPWSDIPLERPSIWILLLYYALLLTPLLPRTKNQARWPRRLAAAGACVMPLLLPLTLASAGPTRTNACRVAVLSVGAGQCAVVHLPSGKTIALDAGSSSIPDVSRQVVSPYLKHHALNRLDAVYISHANADHFNGLAAGMERHPVRRVKITPYFRAHALASGEAKGLLEVLEAARVPVEEVTAGQVHALEDGVTLEVLWPPAGRVMLPNDSSLVARLVIRGQVVLFTGDIQDRAMRVLLQEPEKLKCDVLIAPHHGSAEERTRAFLEACSAKWVISSSDGTLSRKQRRFDELVAGREHLRTSRVGAVFIDVGEGGELRVWSYR